ncbi:MAG: DUF5615 family PIN-like protein [Anaerolineales bacterium]|nr:DUF5615 family PIN-like protein [Anaerolineales bacterium]
MKFLLDMPVSPALLEILEAYEHQGVHAYQIGKEQATDSELLELARRENRVIITADLDFPQLLALSSAAGPGLILFRGGNYSDVEMCDLLERVLKKVSPETLEISVCVVDRKRIRITQLPLRRNS